MSSISTLHLRFRESFGLKGKATFWFGGVIAAVINQLDKNLQIDIKHDQLQNNVFSQFICILNHTLVSAMIFYSQNPPDNFHRFLMFCHQLVTQKNNKTETSYSVSLGKLSLRNNLLIYALTLKQYSHVFLEYQQIMKQFERSEGETDQMFFLAFLSNFLAIISKLEPSKSKYLELKYLTESVQNNLILVFTKLIDKYKKITQRQGSIDFTELQMLIAVYTKHGQFLQIKIQSHFQSLISEMITHSKYRLLPSSLFMRKIYKQKINKQIIFNFTLPFYQLNCFSLNFNPYPNSKNKIKKYLSTKQESQKQDTVQNERLLKIQRMLQQHLSTISSINFPQQVSTIANDFDISSAHIKGGRFRRLNKLNFSAQNPLSNIEIKKTIEVDKSDLNLKETDLTQQNNHQINKTQQFITGRKTSRCGYNYGVMQHSVPPTKVKNIIGRTDTRRFQNNLNLSSFFNNHSHIYPQAPAHLLLKTHNVLHFKMGSIFIEVNNDGMLFSDYTKENKRYVEWNTISQILLRVQYKFIYKSYLQQGVSNYYDVVRILKLYLSKTQMNAISINQYPNMILQLNEFIRFYQQDGHYTKLAYMNIYDNTKLQSEIDCYLEQFDHFFKTVSSDGYLEYLGEKVLKISEKQKNPRQEVFYLQVLRKQNDSVRIELENQLTVDIVESVTNDRDFLYRALFVLKNNARLYAKIELSQTKQKKDITTNQSEPDLQYVMITVKHLSQNAAPIIRHKLSCHLLHQYIPQGQLSHTAYMQSYGRFIFSSFSNFQNFSDETVISNSNFEIITHCSLTEMIEIGKYWTVCSAEIIGSKRMVYGVVIRYAFLPMNKDYVTFLRNPYCGFLRELILMTKQEKKECLRKLLVELSVKKTYLYLQRSRKLNQVSSLIEYLSQGLGIL